MFLTLTQDFRYYRDRSLPERGPCWRVCSLIVCSSATANTARFLAEFIWQEDREPPVIHNVPDSPVNLGCVEEPPNLTCEGIIAQYNIFVTDNCDPSDGRYTSWMCEAGEVQQDGCRWPDLHLPGAWTSAATTLSEP